MSDTGKYGDLKWIDVPALVVFACLFLIVFLQFFTRYVLNDSLGWTEELARYLLIVTAYAGSITALRRGEHIFLEFVYRSSSPANAKPLTVFVEALGFVYHVALTVLALHLAMDADQHMVSIQAPKSIVYAAVAASLAAVVYFSVRRLLRRIRQTSAEILAEIEESATRETQL